MFMKSTNNLSYNSEGVEKIYIILIINDLKLNITKKRGNQSTERGL